MRKSHDGAGALAAQQFILEFFFPRVDFSFLRKYERKMFSSANRVAEKSARSISSGRERKVQRTLFFKRKVLFKSEKKLFLL